MGTCSCVEPKRPRTPYNICLLWNPPGMSYRYLAPYKNKIGNAGYFGKLVRIDLERFEVAGVLDLTQNDPSLVGFIGGEPGRRFAIYFVTCALHEGPGKTHATRTFFFSLAPHLLSLFCSVLARELWYIGAPQKRPGFHRSYQRRCELFQTPWPACSV